RSRQIVVRVRHSRVRGQGELRYRLLHRSGAAICQAQGIAVDRDAMVVRSVSVGPGWVHDLQAFSVALGVSIPGMNLISDAVEREGVLIRVGWWPTPRCLDGLRSCDCIRRRDDLS